jgi:hypothetical protein
MPTVRVGQIVNIVGGQRSGSRAKVLANLNAFGIRAKIIGGKYDGEILENVRFSDYK